MSATSARPIGCRRSLISRRGDDARRRHRRCLETDDRADSGGSEIADQGILVIITKTIRFMGNLSGYE
jgi:hypothetical protein